jgi:hypothetical protein
METQQLARSRHEETTLKREDSNQEAPAARPTNMQPQRLRRRRRVQPVAQEVHQVPLVVRAHPRKHGAAPQHGLHQLRIRPLQQSVKPFARDRAFVIARHHRRQRGPPLDCVVHGAVWVQHAQADAAGG